MTGASRGRRILASARQAAGGGDASRLPVLALGSCLLGCAEASREPVDSGSIEAEDGACEPSHRLRLSSWAMNGLGDGGEPSALELSANCGSIDVSVSPLFVASCGNETWSTRLDVPRAGAVELWTDGEFIVDGGDLSCDGGSWTEYAYRLDGVPSGTWEIAVSIRPPGGTWRRDWIGSVDVP